MSKIKNILELPFYVEVLQERHKAWAAKRDYYDTDYSASWRAYGGQLPPDQLEQELRFIATHQSLFNVDFVRVMQDAGSARMGAAEVAGLWTAAKVAERLGVE